MSITNQVAAVGPAVAGAVRTAGDPVMGTALPAPAPAPAALPAPAPAPAGDKAAILAAAAQGGQGGIDAYKQAQSTLAGLQQNAIANARARAALIGGPESQGFENIANQFYDRGQANLAASNAAFQGQQAANKAAFDKYQSQLKGDLPGINDYINTRLSQYETRKRKAYFPQDEIIGATKAALPQIAQETADTKAALDKAKADLAQQENHAFTTPLIQQRDANAKRMKEIDDYRNSHQGRVPDYLNTEYDDLHRKQQNLEVHIARGTQTENSKAAALRSQVADLQDKYDKSSALSESPENLAVKIATEKYGVSPEKATGRFTPDKFLTSGGTQKQLDIKQYGEEAVGLADKLHINGGAKNVAQLMNTNEYKSTLDEARQHAIDGSMSFNEAKHVIEKQYGKQYPNLTKILIEQISGFGWKKSK